MKTSGYTNSIPATAGIGLRFPHHEAARAQRVASWLEVHPENYLDDATMRAELAVIRGQHALSFHAVGLSLGAAAGPDAVHLARIAALAEELEPALVSDHLSFSSADGWFAPDLLPLPYTREALAIVARNIERVQEVLGRQILVENPSSYLQLAGADYSEAQFLGALARTTGCGVLFDVNNVQVSACNHGAEPQTLLREFLHEVARGSILELHLAGHSSLTRDGLQLFVDDHGSPVGEPVWDLYEETLRELGPLPTLIEWDTHIPALEVLQQQAASAQVRLDAASPGATRGSHALAG